MSVALFIGIAVATGLFGAERTVHGVKDNETARIINEYANQNIKVAENHLLIQRDKTTKAFDELAELKLDVLDHSVHDFLTTFERIKNVDFTDSEGLDELKNLKVKKEDFEELKQLGEFAVSLTEGAVSGVASGALTAFGAWGAAQSLATASTGTAINALNGIAAKNATLAFFGGGSIASGGLGVAGGTVVLGGFIGGAALAVMGLVTAVAAGKQLDDALANKEKSDEITESLKTSTFKCQAIRRRTYLFYNMLAHMDTYFVPQIQQMKRIIETEGEDYRYYHRDSKKIIA